MIAVPTNEMLRSWGTLAFNSEERAQRDQQLAKLRAAICVSDGLKQSDASGVGLVAVRTILEGELLIDPTALYTMRPPADLDPYWYIKLSPGYIILRDDEIRLRSMVSCVNEANHRLDGRSMRSGTAKEGPNVRWQLDRPSGGGTPRLAFQAVAEIPKGTELLADYRQSKLLALSQADTTAAPPPAKKARKTRWIPSDTAKAILEASFAMQPSPSTETKQDLARSCGIDLERINVWFVNRRQKGKKGAAAAAAAGV